MEDSESTIDQSQTLSRLYYLHPVDVLVTPSMNGSNHHSWSRAIMRALLYPITKGKPSDLEVTNSNPGNTFFALRGKAAYPPSPKPCQGVQFHPGSIITNERKAIVRKLIEKREARGSFSIMLIAIRVVELGPWGYIHEGKHSLEVYRKAKGNSLFSFNHSATNHPCRGQKPWPEMYLNSTKSANKI
ncbi:hypothetical protein E2542_SST16873 [Spatholobus suberectus]|nr:hypothetical protein E2542_SST16873 [Spatholobus suberectus]